TCGVPAVEAGAAEAAADVTPAPVSDSGAVIEAALPSIPGSAAATKTPTRPRVVKVAASGRATEPAPASGRRSLASQLDRRSRAACSAVRRKSRGEGSAGS